LKIIQIEIKHKNYQYQYLCTGTGISFVSTPGISYDLQVVEFLFFLSKRIWFHKMIKLLILLGIGLNLSLKPRSGSTGKIRIPQQQQHCRRHQEVTVWGGEPLKFHMSKKHVRIHNPPPEFVLADGSPSVKEFAGERNLNRFITPALASKNRIVRPSAVLHFFNILRMPEAEVEALFAGAGAPVPQKIKWVSSNHRAQGDHQGGEEAKPAAGVGLAYFASVEVRENFCQKIALD
jgi:hypothetical protein